MSEWEATSFTLMEVKHGYCLQGRVVLREPSSDILLSAGSLCNRWRF